MKRASLLSLVMIILQENSELPLPPGKNGRSTGISHCQYYSSGKIKIALLLMGGSWRLLWV